MAAEELAESQETPGTREAKQVVVENEDVSEAEDMSPSSPSPRGVIDMVASVSVPKNESEGNDSCGSSSSSTCTCTDIEKHAATTHLLKDTYGYGLHWKGSIETMMKKSVKRISTMATDSSRRSAKRKLTSVIDCKDIRAMKPSWRCFGFKELANATDGFNGENLLGKGGHAEVYKGRLPDGQIVAVKRIMTNDKQEEEERVCDFLSELGIITHINHPNSAQLLGFGIDGGLYLVLQFSPPGSLESILHGSEESPSWSIRFKVALGVAQGLKYLHHDCQRRIIHRDIKASNILLTEDYEALLSDFGLAKWLPEKWMNHVVPDLEGTFGYLAPEYFMHGLVNEKTDVFAYGVLLLEIITGRRAVDISRQSLMLWAKPLLDSNNYQELVDPRLGDDYDVTEVKRAMFVASVCVNHLSAMRPHMNLVVQLLKGEVGIVELDQKPAHESGRVSLPDGWDMEDHTCSAYQQELSRHKELALE